MRDAHARLQSRVVTRCHAGSFAGGARRDLVPPSRYVMHVGSWKQRGVALGLALAIAAAGVAGAIWWTRTRLPTSTLIGLRAVDAQIAIAVWSSDERTWIGRLGADGSVRW